MTGCKIHEAKTDRVEGKRQLNNNNWKLQKLTLNTARHKINKDIKDLNNTTNQLNLTDICRILHPTTAECTSFSSNH